MKFTHSITRRAKIQRSAYLTHLADEMAKMTRLYDESIRNSISEIIKFGSITVHLTGKIIADVQAANAAIAAATNAAIAASAAIAAIEVKLLKHRVIFEHLHRVIMEHLHRVIMEHLYPGKCRRAGDDRQMSEIIKFDSLTISQLIKEIKAAIAQSAPNGSAP